MYKLFNYKGKEYKEGELFFKLNVGEVFTQEKSDKLMAYLEWFVGIVKDEQKQEIIKKIEKEFEIY